MSDILKQCATLLEWNIKENWYIFLASVFLKEILHQKFTLLRGSYFGQHGVHLVGSASMQCIRFHASRYPVQLCSTIRCSTYLIPHVRTSVLSHPMLIPLILIAPQCNIHILDGFFLDPPVLLWVFWASYEPNDLYPIPFLFKAI